MLKAGSVKYQFLSEHSEMRVWNVHNFEISESQVAMVACALKADIAWAREDPLRRVLFFTGDFNLQPTGEKRLPYSQPINAGTGNPECMAADIATAPHLLRFKRTIMPILETIVEFSQLFPTHYSPYDNSGSKIDRTFSSMPPETYPFSNWTFACTEDARDLHFKGISDHSPIKLSVLQKTRLPNRICPFQRLMWSIGSSHNFMMRWQRSRD
jgi:hypothetical protein